MSELLALIIYTMFVFVESQVCGGYAATDPRACYGRGTCIATNTCNCTSTYQGNLCQRAPSEYYYVSDYPTTITSTLNIQYLPTCSDSVGLRMQKCMETYIPNNATVSEQDFPIPYGAASFIANVYVVQPNVIATYVVYNELSVLSSGLLSTKATPINVIGLDSSGAQLMSVQVFITGNIPATVIWGDAKFSSNSSVNFCIPGFSGVNCTSFSCLLTSMNNI
jgi:hypothetical protein